MQLVDVIEEEIGAPIGAWPTSILTLPFAFDSHMPYALKLVDGHCVFLWQ